MQHNLKPLQSASWPADAVPNRAHRLGEGDAETGLPLPANIKRLKRHDGGLRFRENTPMPMTPRCEPERLLFKRGEFVQTG